jgi:hypothetical protein
VARHLFAWMYGVTPKTMRPVHGIPATVNLQHTENNTLLQLHLMDWVHGRGH